MSENVMLYANQVAVGTSLAQRKPQPDSSFSYSTAEVDAPKPQDPYQPLPLQHTTSCSKSKQPFLKRGTGLQTRIEATRRKRYVPKGGFVKGQTDGDEQSTARPPLLQPLSQASHHHQPLYQAQAPSPQWAEDYDWPPATATSDAQPQQWMPLQQQIAKSAVTTALAEHDLEAEMDADSALVHLPSRPGTQASSQPPSNQKQMLQGNFIAPHASQHLQLPMHSEGIGTEDTRPSVSTSSTQLQPSRADVNSAATEWQLQQATEVCVLYIVSLHGQCAHQCQDALHR